VVPRCNGALLGYARLVNPVVYLFPVVGAVILAVGILLNVFNAGATRRMKRVQRVVSAWPKSERLITPGFVRVLGIYLIVWGTCFGGMGLGAIFQK
jgi:hypothetical protein